MEQRSSATDEKPYREPKDKSLPELLRDLAREIPELIRAEIAAIKAEVREKASLAGQGAALFFAAVLFLMMALFTGTALAIIVFDLFLPLWLAALTVTLLWVLIAVVLGLIGVQRFKKLSADGDGGPDAFPGGAPPPQATGSPGAAAADEKAQVRVKQPAGTAGEAVLPEHASKPRAVKPETDTSDALWQQPVDAGRDLSSGGAQETDGTVKEARHEQGD